MILVDTSQQPWLEAHAALIREELNVKQVEFTREAEHYIDYTVLPDLKRLGPRLGKQLPALRKALAEADPGTLLKQLEREGHVSFELPGGVVDLDSDDIQVRLQAKLGWAAAQGSSAVVVLATEVTPELELEGLARELTHLIQNQRKDLGCEYTDRIAVGVVTEAADVRAAVEQFGDYIGRETLATEIASEPLSGVTPAEATLKGQPLAIYVRVAKPIS